MLVMAALLLLLMCLILPNNAHQLHKRNTITQQRQLWHHKIIPYTIHEYIFNKTLIEETISYFNTLSCVQWVDKETLKNKEQHFVIFTPHSMCSSLIGREESSSEGQPIYIARQCNNAPIILHEMMHVIGFYHEMKRFDRDKYVEIFWENIMPGFEKYFTKLPEESSDIASEEYDISSIMHYGSYAFSKSPGRKKTIRSLIPGSNGNIDEANSLSARDVARINKLYDCHERGYINEGYTTWSSFRSCDNNCKKRRSRFCYSPSGRHNCVYNDHVITEEAECTINECSRDGWWSRWSPWSTCDVMCGKGKQIRYRRCDDPPKRLLGKQCQGEKEISRECKMGSCTRTPNDCEFDNDGYCQWSVKGDSWRIQKSSDMLHDGPTNDVSYGQGNYLLLHRVDVGEMSMSLLAVKLSYVRFYFQMSGDAEFTMDLTLSNGTITSYVVVNKANKHSLNGWNTAVLHLDNSASKIVVHGRLKNKRDFIAVDDVFFTENRYEDGEQMNIVPATTLSTTDIFMTTKSTTLMTDGTTNHQRNHNTRSFHTTRASITKSQMTAFTYQTQENDASYSSSHGNKLMLFWSKMLIFVRLIIYVVEHL